MIAKGSVLRMLTWFDTFRKCIKTPFHRAILIYNFYYLKYFDESSFSFSGIAAVFGIIFIIARYRYRVGYVQDAAKRYVIMSVFFFTCSLTWPLPQFHTSCQSLHSSFNFKGGYLHFSHLTGFKYIYITEIYMRKQYKS